MPPEWVVSWLIPFLVAFMLGITGLAIGLWWGERGRRLASENIRLYGQPTARPARAIPQPADPEERARNYGYSEQMVEAGIKHVQELAKAEGRPLTREEAREQVLYMLHPDTMTEGQPL